MALSAGPQSGAAFFQHTEDYERAYLDFIVEYGRSYSSKGEFLYRLSNFREVYELVQNFENEYMTLGINQMADLSDKEIKERWTGFIPRPIGQDDKRDKIDYPKISSVDWRDQGRVTPVKDQASCGSCWAFAAVAGAEGLHAKKEGYLRDFSEQQLVDCDSQSNGCSGGRFDTAWEYHIENGLAIQSDYPYTA
jgi:C1A family cysteine protease